MLTSTPAASSAAVRNGLTLWAGAHTAVVAAATTRVAGTR